jgi:hypothetical protein
LARVKWLEHGEFRDIKSSLIKWSNEDATNVV